MRQCDRLIAVLSGAFIIASPVAHAQGLKRSGFEIGIDVGPTLLQGTDPQGQQGGCGSARPEYNWSGHLRHNHRSRWAFEISVTHWPDWRAVGPCVLVRAPRATGADTFRTYDFSGHSLRYPLTAAGITASRALWLPNALGLWAELGIGRSWHHSLWIPQAGLRVEGRGRLLRPMLGVALLFFPYDRVALDHIYQDGQLARTERSSKAANEVQVSIRGGVMFAIH